MGPESTSEILLTGFEKAGLAPLLEAIRALGRSGKSGDPVNDTAPSLVLAAAYDEASLRGQRAAAMDDPRPWCFCVPAADRGLVAAASCAREGRMLLLPYEERELKRVLSALVEEAKERGPEGVVSSGLERVEAELSWKTADLDVSRVCRRIAGFLAEAGYYPDRSDEDECALALEEALVNSIEHGNLGLDSALKSDLPSRDDRYEAERARLMADPLHGGKLVRVRVSMSRDEAKVVIEDEGEGFDVSKVAESPSGLEVSGKGYYLIKRPFDLASYSEKGNSLTLSRRKPGKR